MGRQENDPASGHFLQLKIPRQAVKPSSDNNFRVLNAELNNNFATLTLSGFGSLLIQTHLLGSERDGLPGTEAMRPPDLR